MCDQDHFEKDRQEYEARGLVTRREFGMMMGGMAMMLPQVQNAVAVTESEVTVKTADGTADCYFVHPTSGRRQLSSCGQIFSDCGHRSGKWASAWPNPAIRCLW